MSNRWSYQVVKLKTNWWGAVDQAAAQEQLARLGSQGWELVSVAPQGSGYPVLAYLKKEN